MPYMEAYCSQSFHNTYFKMNIFLYFPIAVIVNNVFFVNLDEPKIIATLWQLYNAHCLISSYT